MTENMAFYSQIYDALPDDNMAALAGDAQFCAETGDDGKRVFVYRWPDLSLSIHEMSPDELPEHLDGMAGYVQHMGADGERFETICQRIFATTLGVGVVIEPERDDAGRVEEVLGRMAGGLQPLIFYAGALWDTQFNLIQAPDGSFDEAADILGPVADMQLSEEAEARDQRARAALSERGVPLPDFVPAVGDAASHTLRDARTVARRALALTAVIYYAETGDAADARGMLGAGGGVEDALSPAEQALFERGLGADDPDAGGFVWHFERLWLLLWALGDLDLPYPSGQCDVERLIGLIQVRQAQADWPDVATLRPADEILDALQETLLLHWSIRQAYVDQRPVPIDLVWTDDAELVPVQECPTIGVVAERHHALNWLVCFADAAWDDVDTPT